jgi:hypothetical protein
MYSTMTPIKAFAWTSAYILSGSAVFWSRSLPFREAAYRHWFVYLFYLCLFVPLSWFGYRGYRKGSENSVFANIPKSQKRGMAMVGGVLMICLAAAEIVLAAKVSYGRQFHFALAGTLLVSGADSWRRYFELKDPEVSPLH